ncbi:hypothetical protein MJH12_18535 [bacterium]|nr:hypothetical protein [bacterium]
MKIQAKNSLQVIKSPIVDLIPYNGEKRESSVEEYVLINGQAYLLFSSSIESENVLIHEMDIQEALKRVIDFYQWESSFHPIDSIQWQKVCDFFELGALENSSLFEKAIQKHGKLLQLLQNSSSDLISMVLSKKVDFRMLSFLHTDGFKLNAFFDHLFEVTSFNFQIQKKVIENFGSYFRRNSIDAESFLLENKDLLHEKIESKSMFMGWMNDLTKPSLSGELKRRQGFVKQIKAPQILLKIDETFEDAWLNVQFQVESIEEYREVLSDLTLEDNQSHIQTFFEEC